MTTSGSSSLALLTDLYQLTMAYAYWKAGVAEREAVFHLTFRRHPFGGGFALACGLAAAADLLESLRFTDDDITYLASLEGLEGTKLFAPAFLEDLQALRPAWSVDAIPEGTVVFAGEPLVRVSGPLLQSQILETPLLNLVNFPTLIATKAARVCEAAQGDRVLEFGLRRAQGVDGGVTASRAAYIGGCSATSNLLAGRRFGIPVRGTHAHSFVMAFDDERRAFEAFADAFPADSVFLVDTFDTRSGTKRAIEVARILRDKGQRLAGVRLDSGDLGALSAVARRLLDEAGFSDVAIVASSDLDEHEIARLKGEGAPIAVWGVGTRLATAHDDPALTGVYKLAALRGEDGAWDHRIKLSDDPAKASTPGILQVRRYANDGRFAADVLYDEDAGLASVPDHGASASTSEEDLLVPIYRAGVRVWQAPSTHQVRERARTQLDALPEAVRSLSDPAEYPVLIDASLERLRNDLRRSGEAAAERQT
jgi:nicotinate phosphoribosyltransferase